MTTSSKPYIRFTHSKELRERTIEVLDAIDSDADPTVHRNSLSKIIIELTETGMQYFFIDSVALLDMGSVANRAATLSVHGLLRVMRPTTRRAVSGMNGKQLRRLSQRIRETMGPEFADPTR